MDLAALTALLPTLTDDQLRELIRGAQSIIDRRRIIAQAPIRLAKLAEDFLHARGAKSGDPWQPPSTPNPVEAYYPAGWRVTHKGAVWEAEEAGTITEPGSGGGWRLISGDPPPVPDYDPAATYRLGQRVRFASQVWESLEDDNTGSPTENPPGWNVVTEGGGQ